MGEGDCTSTREAYSIRTPYSKEIVSGVIHWLPVTWVWAGGSGGGDY